MKWERIYVREALRQYRTYYAKRMGHVHPDFDAWDAALDRLAARLSEAEREREDEYQRFVETSQAVMDRALAAEARLSEYEQALQELVAAHDAIEEVGASFTADTDNTTMLAELREPGARLKTAWLAARAALSGSAGSGP